jgi:hypothetical protein
MSEASQADRPPAGESVGEAAPDARGVREIPADPETTPETGTPPLRDDRAGGETSPAPADDAGAPAHETSGEEQTADPSAPPAQD